MIRLIKRFVRAGAAVGLLGMSILGLFDRSHRRLIDQLREVQRWSVAEVGELCSARESVCENHGIGRGVDRRKEVLLGDGDRHLVVPAFHTDVAGESTAAGHCGLDTDEYVTAGWGIT